jgi:hypothetical protein
MVALTESQKRFLNSQQIPESAVFDASGLPPRRYRPEMERQEKLFAIGVSECFRRHQSIRTRAGHCIQCGTASIGFIMRYYREAYVYIAGSRREKVVKIGCSKTPWDRGQILNTLGYGNISDWQLLYYAKYSDAGKVEFAVHRHLSEFASPRRYIREYNAVDCREIFSCGYSEARQALTSASPDGATNEYEYSNAPFSYEFLERKPPAQSISTPEPEREEQPELEGSPAVDAVFFQQVDELELSVRTANCLKNEGIVYIGELVQKTEAEMLRTPNFGRKSLNELKEVLSPIGLHFGMVIEEWPRKGVVQ